MERDAPHAAQLASSRATDCGAQKGCPKHTDKPSSSARDERRGEGSGRTYVYESGDRACAALRPSGRRMAGATETAALAGGSAAVSVVTAALAAAMCVGTVVVLRVVVVGARMGGRRASGIGRRFGLGWRRHDDFDLGIRVEDVLGLIQHGGSG